MDGEAGIRIVQQMKGSMSQIRYPNPSAFERAIHEGGQECAAFNAHSLKNSERRLEDHFRDDKPIGHADWRDSRLLSLLRQRSGGHKLTLVPRPARARSAPARQTVYFTCRDST
jgi:hypothetical protein